MARNVQIMPPVRLLPYLFSTGRTGNAFDDVLLTLRGRDAIALAAEHCGLGPEDLVLLPGYICDTVQAGFGARGRFDYYDIREDFTIDLQAIRSLMKGRDVKILYVIHYFGFLHRNLAELKKICREHGAVLWEDHAHSGLSRFSRDHADAMIFSFRKILPVPDGGGLWLPDAGDDLSPAGSQLKANAISMMMLAKRNRWFEKLHLTGLVNRAITQDVDRLKTGRKSVCPRPMSSLSRRKVRRSTTKRLFKVRRKLFGRWQELLQEGPFVPVHADLPDDVAPLGCPIWVANPVELREKMDRVGLYLKIHWQSRLEQVPRKCPTTCRMCKQIITLPVYPGLTELQMLRIRDLLGQWARPAPPPPAPEFRGQLSGASGASSTKAQVSK